MAILYADKMTDSMQAAIGETERRRNKQVLYNERMGITPKGVQKRIKDIIDGVYDLDEEKKQLKAAQAHAKYEAMPEKDLERELKRVERDMLDAAKNLEFERAAELRDRLTALRRHMDDGGEPAGAGSGSSGSRGGGYGRPRRRRQGP
jgi:excinuclease ABC subunit B